MNRSHHRLAVFIAIFTTMAFAARAQEPLNVGVRTELETPAWKKDKNGQAMRDAVDRRRIFTLSPPIYVKTDEPLVKPVDENALLMTLYQELLKHGYTPAAPNQTPEILITLQYGRGYMKNPYVENSKDGGSVNQSGSTSDGNNFGGLRVVTIQTMPIRSREIGVEEKTQRAWYEKLTIFVSAWDYQSAKAGKGKRLWSTSMYVDDPDHRDLGQVYKQMLAAGAEYFNREMDKEEVDINTSMREGHVELGTPTVVDDKKSDRK